MFRGKAKTVTTIRVTTIRMDDNTPFHQIVGILSNKKDSLRCLSSNPIHEFFLLTLKFSRNRITPTRAILKLTSYSYDFYIIHAKMPWNLLAIDNKA